MSNRKYNYVVEDVNQLESMKFCPYCGSDTMYVYLGDWHNYTVCLECEEELEFMAVMKELEGMSNNTCRWTENNKESGWDTECGSWFFIEDISFDDNPVKDVGYCLNCDKKIEVEE